MSRFVKPALWTTGVLAAGLLAFWLVLALDIPYQSTGTPVTTPATTTQAQPSRYTVQTPYVTEVRPGPDDHTILLRITMPTCALPPKGEVTEAGNRINARVLVRIPSGARCGDAPVNVPVKTAAPIGDRQVVVNDTQSWAFVSGGWKRCNERLGCHPPADHCDPAWVGQLESAAEAEYSGTTRACDQNWLIQDLQRHSGQAATRIVYRWADTGWASVARATGAGCGEILATEPKFPTALCTDLAPPG